MQPYKSMQYRGSKDSAVSLLQTDNNLIYIVSCSCFKHISVLLLAALESTSPDSYPKTGQMSVQGRPNSTKLSVTGAGLQSRKTSGLVFQL